MNSDSADAPKPRSQMQSKADPLKIPCLGFAQTAIYQTLLRSGRGFAVHLTVRASGSISIPLTRIAVSLDTVLPVRCLKQARWAFCHQFSGTEGQYRDRTAANDGYGKIFWIFSEGPAGYSRKDLLDILRKDLLDILRKDLLYILKNLLPS